MNRWNTRKEQLKRNNYTSSQSTIDGVDVESWLPGEEIFTFSKGRVALYALLQAIGIKEDDEVLVPGFTCIVVPFAIRYSGGKPVFYDIDIRTYNGTEDKILELMSPKTRVVILQHTFGMPMECSTVISECRAKGIYVIEDCAHSMGGGFGSDSVGRIGDAAFASFQWSKPVTIGLGGIARVNNPLLREALSQLYSDSYREPTLWKSASINLLAWGFHNLFSSRLYWSARKLYHCLGYLNIAPTSSSSSELSNSEQLPPEYSERLGRRREKAYIEAVTSLPSSVDHRARIASLYYDWCQSKQLPVQESPRSAMPVYLRFPILVDNKERLLKEAKKRRIEIGDWFNAPLHPKGANFEALGFDATLCPNATWVSERIINLPTHQAVSDAEAYRALSLLEQKAELLTRDSVEDRVKTHAARY